MFREVTVLRQNHRYLQHSHPCISSSCTQLELQSGSATQSRLATVGREEKGEGVAEKEDEKEGECKGGREKNSGASVS